MPNAAIAAEVHQPLDAHRDLAAEVAFHRELADALAELIHLRVGQILDLRRRRNAGRDANSLRAWTADAVDRRQRDLRVLMVGDVNACNTCHGSPQNRLRSPIILSCPRSPLAVPCVLSRGSLRSVAYLDCSPHFEIP